MDDSPRKGWWPDKKVRWYLLAAYTTAWTVALLVPMPDGRGWSFHGINLKFLVVKGVHLGAYAVLAGLLGWLEIPSRYRWLLVFFLAGHATATEFFQQFIEGRTGMIQDIGIDLIGAGIGCAITWKWWTDPR